jgi:hypothetical protein
MLEAETNEISRRTLDALMAAARRKPAFLEATAKEAELGQRFAPLSGSTSLRGEGQLEQLQRMLAAEAGPCMLLDPGRGLTSSA